MSIANRKALYFLVTIGYLKDLGHFRVYADTIDEPLEKLMKVYRFSEVSENMLNTFKESMYKIEADLQKLGFTSSQIMMLKFVEFTAVEFLEYVKGEKADLWEQLRLAVVKLSVSEYTKTKQFNKAWEREFDKANAIIELIKENVK